MGENDNMIKKLSELYPVYQGKEVEIKGIKINSKQVEPGDLFVCTKGVTTDRHDFIDDAIKHGASAVVISKEMKEKSVPLIKVDNTNEELPRLCRKFYDHPEEKLKLISVGGTDGKTTTSTIIQALLTDEVCGYIGTNGRRCSKFDKDTDNTTPDSDKLYAYFDEFLRAGCKMVVMETSSEAFFRHRLDGLFFDCGAITNITSEHLNIHGSFENYLDCKCQQFRQIKDGGISVLNFDDAHFEEVKKNVKGTLYTYGKDKSCTLWIKEYQIHPKYTEITYVYEQKEEKIKSPLLGEFNVYNLAAGILIALSLGVDFDTIKERIANIKVSGRLEVLPDMGQKFDVMIDYAHTPNGILNLLTFIHTLDIRRSIVVIGQAGERDYLKRPVVGKVVCDNASYAIFCYEDPRSEDPKDIIDMMTRDVHDKNKYEIVIDRSQAIKRAINIAEEKDMVLILGKGNETYEKLRDGTIYFNDIEEATKHLKARLEREKNYVTM